MRLPDTLVAPREIARRPESPRPRRQRQPADNVPCFAEPTTAQSLELTGSPLDSIIEPNSNSAEGNAMSLEVADVGAIHDWTLADHFKLGLGALYDFDFAPSSPVASYGSDPHGTMVFLRIISD
jgi:hypothetical protein